MPIRQTNTTLSSAVDRIRPVTTKLRPIKLSIYGNPKTGKTRVMATFPKPLLVIGFEDGTQSIVGVQDTDFVQLESTSEFPEMVRHARACGKYRTIGLDNGTRMRDMRLFEILGLTTPIQQKNWGMASREQYGAVSNSLKEMWAPLLDIPRTHDINIVVIAQEQEWGPTEENPKKKHRVSSALGESLEMWLNAECDYVAQTFIQKRLVKTTQTFPNGKSIEHTQDTGELDYCLRIGPHDIYQTGFRQQLGAKRLPPFLVDPSYDKIVAAIKGTME